MPSVDAEVEKVLVALAAITQSVGLPPDHEEGPQAPARGATTAAFANDKFMVTRTDLVREMETVEGLLEGYEKTAATTSSLLSSSGAPQESGERDNATIKQQAAIRAKLQEARSLWEALDKLYQDEVKKRRSKFSDEELVLRCEAVSMLKNHLAGLEETWRALYTGRARSEVKLESLDTVVARLKAAHHHHHGGGGGGGGGAEELGSSVVAKYEHEEVTSEQSVRLQQIQLTKAKHDQTLEEIGDLVDGLHDRAGIMRDQVEAQNNMIHNTLGQLDSVQEHLDNVTGSLGATLKSVRGSDHMCMDIFCLLVLFAIIGLYLKFTAP